MMNSFTKSPLWDFIFESESFKSIDINTFKNDGANSKITQYSHKTHGIFFFKNLVYQMAKQFDESELDLLNNVPNRDTGGGLTISYKQILLDLDYLLALEEAIFLQDKLKTINSVLEIGAGYGRTCHTILSLFPNITRYDIIDLPKMLGLSTLYLKTVATEANFSKINFIPVGEIGEEKYDLVINIDSMQEMDQKTVESYLQYINNYGEAFYTKNTVGKFEPSLCGWEESEGSKIAHQSGILRDVVNIFCPVELENHRIKFIQKFSPGENWVVKKQADTMPWSHLYQTLFQKK